MNCICSGVHIDKFLFTIQHLHLILKNMLFSWVSVSTANPNISPQTAVPSQCSDYILLCFSQKNFLIEMEEELSNTDPTIKHHQCTDELLSITQQRQWVIWSNHNGRCSTFLCNSLDWYRWLISDIIHNSAVPVCHLAESKRQMLNSFMQLSWLILLTDIWYSSNWPLSPVIPYTTSSQASKLR